jgi:hypothetical protein
MHAPRAVVEQASVDEAVPGVGGESLLVGLVDPIGRDEVHFAADAVYGAKSNVLCDWAVRSSSRRMTGAC